MASDECVRVALRIRPQNARERIDLCRVCTVCTPGQPQVVLGKDKAFTYDYVYDMDTNQPAIYESCVEHLVERCFDGFNATVMAYGQTGAGKTYTMGTGFDVSMSPEEIGVVPRAVRHIFDGIASRQKQAQELSQPAPQFQLHAEFLELYNEEIIDLFDHNRDQVKKNNMRIHEDANGQIYIAGITSRTVNTAAQMMNFLKEGALSRTTASTCMNAQSSRSHAVFTLHIVQQRLVSTGSPADGDSQSSPSSDNSIDFETLTAKLHFVDLAGSERLKRTGATGDRAKEGISINCGLLALGNVISALGDKSKKSSHVPYRDSKLTRLLQDSLGGNSQTLMVACISPSDRDFMETLNTLKYANRARNIKNKVTVNQDKASQQLTQLRAEIQRLNLELEEFRQGRRSVTADGECVMNDMFYENNLLRAENDKLKLRLKALQETVEQQSKRLAQMQAHASLGKTANGEEGDKAEDSETSVSSLIEGYLTEIENLKSQLLQSETLARMSPKSPFRRRSTESRLATGMIPQLAGDSAEGLLADAHRDMERLREQQKSTATERSSTAGPSGRRSRRNRAVENGETLERETNGVVSGADSEEEDESADHSESGEDGVESASSDSELDENAVQTLEDDLAALSSEIDIKQRLIDQLEASQQQLHSMRKHYEDQLLVLQNKIKATQTERDQVLSSLEMKESTDEQMKKIHGEYEQKLKSLKNELGKLKRTQKEHQSVLRAKAKNEQQLKQLQRDVVLMRQQRVKLMRELRQEAHRSREQDARRNREIQALRRETRRRETHIKNLEIERDRREAVLRRKNEEVAMLRRQRQAAAPAAAVSGRTRSAVRVRVAEEPSSNSTGVSNSTAPSKKMQRRKSSIFSTAGGRQKWQQLERMINCAVSRRSTISSLEHDMDRCFADRDRLSQELEECRKKHREAVADDRDETELSVLSDQLEGLSAQLEYVQENIDQRQDEIMQVMETKDEGDTVDATGLLSSCSMREARYLLDHFLHMVISSGLQAAQSECESKELRGQLTACEQQLSLREQMLLQLAADDSDLSTSAPERSNGAELDKEREVAEENRRSPPAPALTTTAPPSQGNDEGLFPMPDLELFKQQSAASNKMAKVRRRSSSSTELLYPLKRPLNRSMSVTVIEESEKENENEDSTLSNEPMKSRQLAMSLPSLVNVGSGKLVGSQSLTSSTEDLSGLGRQSSAADTDKDKRRARASSMQSGDPNKTRSRADTPSPDAARPRSSSTNDTNVFERLTNSGSVPEVILGGKRHSGIQSAPARRDKTQILQWQQTAEGHTRPVLSVFAYQTALFTGSQDRTAKIWDLTAGKEVVSLGGHPSSVVHVTYCAQTGLVFTASQSLVKVWDVRENQMKCVKMFGPTTNSGTASSAASDAVHDMVLSDDCSVLYTTCGSAIRVYDLRRLQILGRLTGCTAPVSALALVPPSENSQNDCLAAGARDHYIRLFEVNPKGANIQVACHTLEPPHYDGVQSLFVHDGQMYSGSRDHSLKQWDLASQSLKQSINGAHNAWVCSLLRVPDTSMLASACRSGLIKLWQLGTCAPLGEINAHKLPINSMATSKSLLFTASSDNTVKIWKSRSAK